MLSFKTLLLTSAVGSLLAVGSCNRDEGPDLGFPERCLEVAGVPELVINDTLQDPGAATGYWSGSASADARWTIIMETDDYVLSLARGESAFTNDEMVSLTTEEWKEELESRGSISLKNGIDDGRLWFIVFKPDGLLHLGDDDAEIVDGNVTMKVEVVDGCDMIKVDVYCLMADATHSYEIKVSYRYPYHFK